MIDEITKKTNTKQINKEENAEKKPFFLTQKMIQELGFLISQHQKFH